MAHSNTLDFPRVEDIGVSPNKRCPRCKSHLRTVQCTNLNVREVVGAEVECYKCEIRFTWFKGVESEAVLVQ